MKNHQNSSLSPMHPKSGLLLSKLGKKEYNLFGVCRVIFDDNIKNGDLQEVGTIPSIEKALVNTFLFLQKLEILVFRGFWG